MPPTSCLRDSLAGLGVRQIFAHTHLVTRVREKSNATHEEMCVNLKCQTFLKSPNRQVGDLSRQPTENTVSPPFPNPPTGRLWIFHASQRSPDTQAALTRFGCRFVSPAGSLERAPT